LEIIKKQKAFPDMILERLFVIQKNKFLHYHKNLSRAKLIIQQQQQQQQQQGS